MIVVDASVVVRILANEAGADAALRRIGAETERLAPNWIRVEVGNALCSKVIHQQLPAASVSTLLHALPSYVGSLRDTLPLLEEAVALSLRLKHAVYDCLYLVLAVREGALLVTADKRFVELLKEAGLATHVELLR